jgi:hypothetical protein
MSKPSSRLDSAQPPKPAMRTSGLIATAKSARLCPPRKRGHQEHHERESKTSATAGAVCRPTANAVIATKAATPRISSSKPPSGLNVSQLVVYRGLSRFEENLLIQDMELELSRAISSLSSLPQRRMRLQAPATTRAQQSQTISLMALRSRSASRPRSTRIGRGPAKTKQIWSLTNGIWRILIICRGRLESSWAVANEIRPFAEL